MKRSGKTRTDDQVIPVAEIAAESDSVSTQVVREVVSEQTRVLTEMIAEVQSVERHSQRMLAAVLDGIGTTRERLRETRKSTLYERTFAEKEPLVTVRIATYNRPGPLIERTLPSVIRQTYEHLEVIVVGDGCTDDTADRIEAIGDERIKFVNLPFRHPYPDDPRDRWLVAGSPAMNVGAQLASGLWIAPLDDDDEFVEDHVEVLLQEAIRGRFEMTYGQLLRVETAELPSVVLRAYPPAFGQFGFQAALYAGCLKFMEYETRSWLLAEPGDWNLCRRMMEAGVRIGFVDRVVCRYFPSPRSGSAE
jgi:hypothetical protein